MKSIGVGRDEVGLSVLEYKTRQWIKEQEGVAELFPSAEAKAYDAVFAGIGQHQLRLVGPDLIYEQLFNKIGFCSIETSDNDLFKSLVVTRLYRPGSKLQTIRYMGHFMHRHYEKDRLYRFLDELCWRGDEGNRENG